MSVHVCRYEGIENDARSYVNLAVHEYRMKLMYILVNYVAC